MNENEFKVQIDLYRSITAENIKDATMNHGTISFALRHLTGIGNKKKCNICNYKKNNSCDDCIHNYLQEHNLSPEKQLWNANYACVTPSFNNIMNTSAIDDLPNLLKNRADYLEKCLEIYTQEVDNENN